METCSYCFVGCELHGGNEPKCQNFCLFERTLCEWEITVFSSCFHFCDQKEGCGWSTGERLSMIYRLFWRLSVHAWKHSLLFECVGTPVGACSHDLVSFMTSLPGALAEICRRFSQPVLYVSLACLPSSVDYSIFPPSLYLFFR